MVEVIDEIHLSLERFIVVVVATNGVVAGAAWAAFWWLGLNNSAMWGVFGGALNTIPYVGSALSTGVFFIVAFLQFDSLETAALVAGAFIVITGLEGMWLKPWLMGRTARMNNVAVFVGLLFWGWLWGPWGMLLAYPIMMVIKTVADHVERMHPVAELLSE
jgi:predicted PurR-regulated permease PerM